MLAPLGVVKDHPIFITDTGRCSVIAISPFIPLALQKQAYSVEDFTLVEELYRGVATCVFKAIDNQSGITVALKLYRKRRLSTLSKYQVEREICIHVALDHENIIKLYCAFEDEKNVYMVQEFAGSGDLSRELKRTGVIKEKYAVRDVLAPYLNALCYLHTLDIVHRDIKPKNILLTSNKMIKVADFWLSIDCSSERPVTPTGTLCYMAPEVLACPEKKLPEENKDRALLVYGPAVDVWSVGVLAFELLTGCPPFKDETAEETCDSITYKEPKLPSSISSEARSFILAAMDKNASARPSVVDLLKHPWILQHARSRQILKNDRVVQDHEKSLYRRQSSGLISLLKPPQAPTPVARAHRSQSQIGVPGRSLPPRSDSYVLPSIFASANGQGVPINASRLHKSQGLAAPSTSISPVVTHMHHLIGSLPELDPTGQEPMTTGSTSQNASFCSIGFNRLDHGLDPRAKSLNRLDHVLDQTSKSSFIHSNQSSPSSPQATARRATTSNSVLLNTTPNVTNGREDPHATPSALLTSDPVGITFSDGSFTEHLQRPFSPRQLVSRSRSFRCVSGANQAPVRDSSGSDALLSHTRRMTKPMQPTALPVSRLFPVSFSGVSCHGPWVTRSRPSPI